MRCRSGCHKIGDENKQQQAVENKTRQCRGKDSFPAMLANAKQGRDAQTDSSHNEHQCDQLQNHLPRDLVGKREKEENNDGTNPACPSSLVGKSGGRSQFQTPIYPVAGSVNIAASAHPAATSSGTWMREPSSKTMAIFSAVNSTSETIFVICSQRRSR